MSGWAYLDHPAPIAFAHRGGALDAPENSMEAFDAAVRLGYRYLETDVHLTADGVVVALHDASLDRVADRSGAVADLTWAEVSGARIDGVGTIPRLDDLLTSFPRARFNIDPKSDAVLEPLLERLQASHALERVCIGSFSDRRVARAAERLGPSLCTSPGPRGIARLRAASVGAPVGAVTGGCVQVPTRARGVTIVTERFIREVHRRKMAVHVWTIDDPDEMHRLLDLGVDGIMTDKPRVLREVLEARGAWVSDR